MWLTSITLGVVFLTLWLSWRRSKFNLFKRLNIPGPEPNILFGNFWELMHEGQHNCISKWIKEYGRVFGYYYGLRPVLVVADLDLLRIIQQKEFHKFSHRPKLLEVGNSSKDFNQHSLTVVNGKKWKDLRSIITPTFTTSKLKMMTSIVQNSIDELISAIEKKSADGKAFDIYNLYQNLTMDVIARTSLGVHTNAQNDEKEPFSKLSRIIFSFKMNYFSMLAFSFTEFMSIFSFMRRIIMSWYNEGRNPRGELQERTASVISARRIDTNSRRVDVLQLMMDAQKTEENVNDNSLTAGENDDYIPNGTTKQEVPKNGKKLSDKEVLQNAVLFLLAGFETTSTALAFITHCLVENQDVQEKVRQEIKSKLANNNDLSYDVVLKLQCLDRVINESLRLYPPVTYFVNRQAVEDTTIENLRIPKEVAIQIPVYYLHHDPTIWEDPEKFDPDRFSPEEKANRHPMAFQAFGAGPRNCIGMRFAQMEIKMALAKLLYKYKFLPAHKDTPEKFEVRQTFVTDRPAAGVFIEVKEI